MNLFFRILVLAIGIVFCLLARKLPAADYEGNFGIRTTWAMKSPENWIIAQRFGAKVFLVCGILMIFTGFLVPAAWVMPAFEGELLGMVIVLFGWSWTR